MKQGPEKKSYKSHAGIILAGILFAAAFWVLGAAVDTFIFMEGDFTGNLLAPASTEVWMRLFVVAMIIGISVYTLYHIAEREMLENELKRLAVTDSLTQAYKRIKFNDIIEMEMERARRFLHPLSIIMLDIDRFKDVNDKYGHAVGDEVLRNATKVFKEHIRKIDYLVRWGGEEFVIITPETPLLSAWTLADRIRKVTEGEEFDKLRGIKLSLGVAEFKRDEDVDGFLKRVDDALYKAKSKGMNRVESSA